MALLYSPEFDKNFSLPDFSLRAMDEKTYSLSDLKSDSVKVFLFICNHCPYVKAIEERIIEIAHEYKDKNVEFIGVCSNDPSDYPEDSFESLQKTWREKNYGFVYLHDDKQTLAKAFDAVCTPDIFVFNSNSKLTYRGQLDDSWKSATNVKRRDLKLAIDATLNNTSIDFDSVPSMGCSIKWID